MEDWPFSCDALLQMTKKIIGGWKPILLLWKWAKHFLQSSSGTMPTKPLSILYTHTVLVAVSPLLYLLPPLWWIRCVMQTWLSSVHVFQPDSAKSHRLFCITSLRDHLSSLSVYRTCLLGSLLCYALVIAPQHMTTGDECTKCNMLSRIFAVSLGLSSHWFN